MSSGSPVESVRRTLALLEELNRQRINSIQHLHEATALPKSTIVRLLETLRLLGYVANDPRQGGYQVTSGVRGLSSGFHGDPLVVLKAPGDVKAWEAHLADPIVTPQNTLDYYSAVEKAAGGNVADHFRLITEAGFDPLTALENGSRTALRRTACSRPRRTRTATSCGRGRCARFHKKRCIEERATPRTPQTIAARRRRGVELSTFGVSKPEEIAPAINATKASGAEAINFLATPLFSVPGSPDDGRFQCDQGVFPVFPAGKKGPYRPHNSPHVGWEHLWPHGAR